MRMTNRWRDVLPALAAKNWASNTRTSGHLFDSLARMVPIARG